MIDLEVDTVVPGHGPITDKGGVAAVKGYLEYIASLLTKVDVLVHHFLQLLDALDPIVFDGVDPHRTSARPAGSARSRHAADRSPGKHE